MSDDIGVRASELLREGAGKRPLPDVLADITALDTRPHEPGCPLRVPLVLSSCACPGLRREREKAEAGTLLSSLACLGGGLPLPPAPRPGSGRERHVRRLQARKIAGELKLREDDVYHALGCGESEEQIRAQAAAKEKP